MSPRRIAVFTSSRADLGPLGPVIRALDAEPDVQLVVIATGTHSGAPFGGRLTDIQISPESVLEVVEAHITTTNPTQLAEAYGRIATGTSKVLASSAIDLMLMLGDRWELLAAASAALLHGVPIAHLHGGETTEGAIDERIRHGITKLADLHLCATTDSARRIRHLGEEPWRIVVTGAPGLDRIHDARRISSRALEDLLGFPPKRPFGVVVYHPPTVDRVELARRARAVIDASAHELGSVLVLYPGADPGADEVIAEIERAIRFHSNVVAARNLGDAYLSLLKVADVLVGNSSSGIIEASSLELPAIDVGDRQKGRLRPANVIHVEEVEIEVRSAIVRATSSEFRASLSGISSPYGDGSSARRIVSALLEVPLADLLQKPLMQQPRDGLALHSMTIPFTATLRDAAEAIDRGRCQIGLVIDGEGRLAGTVVDGDIRRALLAGATLESPVAPFTTVVPVVALETDGKEQLLRMMQHSGVTQIPVLDDDGRLVGLHMLRAVVNDLWDATSVDSETGVGGGAWR